MIKTEGQKDRIFILDLLRGVAVFLMILAHSVYFIHNGANPLLLGLEKIGNTLAFTTFLAVSGATAYIAYLKDENLKKTNAKKRFWVLVFAYFGLALFVGYPQIAQSYGFDKITAVFNILLLRDLPSFTEYIPPFIIFFGLLILFPRFFKKIATSVPKAVAFSFSVYFLGMLFYQLPVAAYTVPWKALLSGAEGFFRFPLLQYFPVYVLGLSWGHWLLNTRSLKHQREITESIALATFIGFVGSASLGFFIPNIKESLFLRWPPSIPFLMLGITVSFALATLIYFFGQLKKLKVTRDALLLLGQNALALVVTHILILTVYDFAGGSKTDSFLIFVGLFLLTIIGSLALATFIPFNLRFRLNFHNQGCLEEKLQNEPLVEIGEEIYKEAEKELTRFEKFFKKDGAKTKNGRLIKKHQIIGASITFILASFVAVPSVYQEVEQGLRTQKEATWISEDYAYRKVVEVENNEVFSSIPKGELVSFEINHENLVAEGKSNKEGSDLLLVYWDGNSYRYPKFYLKDSDSNKTVINFEIQKNITPGGKIRNYFLYYGNFIAEKRSSDEKKIIWPYRYQITTEKEESYPLIVSTDRHWYLKTQNKEVEKKGRISLVSKKTLIQPQISFFVPNTNISGKLEETSKNYWEGTFSTENLKPGKYQIQATIRDGDATLSSQKSGFFVSYPLYVAWTQDWEGYDVSDSYLLAMSNLSQKYQVPMTHLYNPRLFVTKSVSEKRKKYLTDWVLKRAQKGEEIGLHLHMFYDLLGSAGVAAKKLPNWGDKGDGYGSLTTNYSREEMVTLLNHSINLFVQNGLPFPNSFRAGGWFAGLETLKALDAVGIKIDSSGRTAYKFFSQKGPWELTATSQPYHPSQNNQNTENSPNLAVLEIPNNGADSYWFSSDEMIKRLHDNYRSGILNEKRQITYLSHPHWFKKEEQKKIENLFLEIERIKYTNDEGPAIYVTLSEIHGAWENN